jgi:hypothetical protein
MLINPGIYRASIAAKLGSLFPLQWMPVLGGTAAEWEGAEKGRRQGRERAARAASRASTSV